MVTVLVTIKVNNFIEWKKIFDDNEAIRSLHNIKTLDLYLCVNDPDYIVIHFEVESEQKFKDYFMNDEYVQYAIKKYSLLEYPVIEFLNKRN